MSVTIKTEKEQNLMRQAGKILGRVLSEVEKKTKPGITPHELDLFAEKIIREAGAIPSFKGYSGFPATLCTSVNEQVVHSIPTTTPLKKGDIISIDCGVYHNGYHADSAITVFVGEVHEKVKSFVATVQEALDLGIRAAQPGNHVRDIGTIIQKTVEKKGYSVVRDLTGHGIGKELHEDPYVPNFKTPTPGMKLKAGMTLAIEPIINMGKKEVVTQDDGWTIVTKDGSLSAQIEHTILITEKGPEILTIRP